jgi:hypothetical protein
MKNAILFSAIFLTFSQLAVADATLPAIKEGLWEITFKSDTAAMPTTMPSMSYTSQQCLTQQKAADPRTFLQSNQCAILNLNQQADLISWDMRCEQQGNPATGDGKVSYQSETFAGIFSINMHNDGASALKTTTQVNGRYMGSCK